MAKCPNINDEVWKQIVDKHGEMVAVDAYIENGYEIPDSLESVTHQDASLWDSDRHQRNEKYLEVTKAKSKILNALVAKLNAYEQGDNVEYVKGLRTLISDFSEAHDLEGALIFMKNAEKQLDLLEPRLKEVKDDLALLKQAGDFAGTYEFVGLISDVLSDVDKAPALKERLSSITQRVKDFKTNYNKYAKSLFINRMSNESPIMTARRKLELGEKYRKDNYPPAAGVTKEEYKASEKAYVDKAINEERNEILQLDKDYIRQLLTVAPKDISDISSSWVDPRSINDPMIQRAVELLDKADFRAKEAFLEDRVESINKFKKFAYGVSTEDEYETSKEVDVSDTIEELRKNKDKFEIVHKSPTESVYVNKETGEEYTRVTSYITDKPPTPNELLETANNIGTAIDEMVRDFFDEKTKFNINNYSVMDGDTRTKFLSQLKELKKGFEERGETVVSDDIMLFDDKTKIAGTVDLLTYDKLGNFRIYDMKTMRSDDFADIGYGQRYDSTAVFTDSGKKKDNGETKWDKVPGASTDSKRTKHSKQLSMYSALLKARTGKGAVELNVIPIKVQYDAGDTTTTEADLRALVPHKFQKKIKNVNISKERTIKSKPKRVASNKVQSGVDKTGTFITDQKALYKDIYEEKDGKATGYYTREFYSEFYIAEREMQSEFGRLLDLWKSETKNLSKSDRNQSYEDSEHMALMNAFVEKYYKYPDKGRTNSNIKTEYRNDAYDTLQGDSRKKEMYDYLIEFNKESDAMVTGAGKLGYKLPSMTKKDSELLSDQGLVGTVKQKWSDLTKTKVDDTEAGEISSEKGVIKVLTDEHGESLKRVAVPFRGDLDIEDQSFDLMGMALSNRFASRNYKEKGEVKIELEVMRDLVTNRELLYKQGGKQVVQSVLTKLGVSKQEEAEVNKTIEGSKSNSLKVLSSLLEDRLYGKANKGDSEVMQKLTSTAIQWSAHNMLIGNFLGATANALAGKTMNFFQSIKGDHYNTKNVLNAEVKYLYDLAGNAKDFGAIQSESNTNLFINKFLDTSMGWSGLSNGLTSDSKIKNILSTSTLHLGNTSAEHYIQSTMMYATLDNIKVLNKKGQFVNKYGSVVETRSEAATMDEMYENIGGELTWKNDDFTVEGFDEVNSDTEFAINRKMKDIAADLHGNYDANNKAMIQRYWYGKLAFYLRKWVVRSAQNRWRGIETTNKSFMELEEHERFFSSASGDYKEGSYTSAVRFVRQHWKDLKSFQLEILKLDWHKLTDMEKGNIKRAVAEISMMFACFAASAFLAKLAGEDEDEDPNGALYKAAYLMRRQAAELFAFTPIGLRDGLKTVTTPSAVSSTLESTLKAGGQVLGDGFGIVVGNDLSVYESGKNKGESKSKVLLLKALVPGYKASTGTAKEKLAYFNK